MYCVFHRASRKAAEVLFVCVQDESSIQCGLCESKGPRVEEKTQADCGKRWQMCTLRLRSLFASIDFPPSRSFSKNVSVGCTELRQSIRRRFGGRGGKM